jgi:hypothetical protein
VVYSAPDTEDLSGPKEVTMGQTWRFILHRQRLIRVLNLLAVLGLLLALVGCGGGTAATPTPTLVVPAWVTPVPTGSPGPYPPPQATATPPAYPVATPGG